MNERLGYRLELDGIRGVAIAMVMIGHAWHVKGGLLGVDLFFVLSGFLITSLLLEEHAATGGVSLRRFYIRRAVRLWPALLLMLATVSAGALAYGSAPDRIAASAGVGASYAVNILLVVHPSAVASWLPHLWSLAEEEQFYLVFPPLLILALRRGRRRLLAVVLAVAVAASIVDLYMPPWSSAHRYSGPDTHASPILLGCLVAVLWKSGISISSRVGLSAAAGAAGTAALMTMQPGLVVFPLFATCCALAIHALASGPVPLVTVTLRSAPLVLLGRISYSLYLWHFVLLAMPVAIAYPAALCVATASTGLIERPLIHYFKQRKESDLRTVHDRDAHPAFS